MTVVRCGRWLAGCAASPFARSRTWLQSSGAFTAVPGRCGGSADSDRPLVAGEAGPALLVLHGRRLGANGSSVWADGAWLTSGSVTRRYVCGKVADRMHRLLSLRGHG